TNQWVAGADRDPATDTYASPEVWARFPDFYRLADAASKIAFAASRATRGDEFKAQICNCAPPALAAMPSIRRSTDLRLRPGACVLAPAPRMTIIPIFIEWNRCPVMAHSSI